MVITALITPFDDELKVDFESLKKLIEFQIENKVDGIVLFGTTGESPTLDDEEFLEMLDFIKPYKKQIKFIIGVGSNNTKKTLKKAQISKENGFNEVLVVVPYYNKPNLTGLFEHFSSIAKTGLKIIVYDIPGRTSIQMPYEILKSLKELYPENITYLKFSNTDMDLLSKIILNIKNLKVLSGDDNLTLPMMSLGAVGVVSVLSNAFPKEIKELVYYAIENDFKKAKEIHYKLYELFKLAFIETNPVPIKYICYKKGLIKKPYVRLPLGPLSDVSSKTIDEKIKNYS